MEVCYRSGKWTVISRSKRRRCLDGRKCGDENFDHERSYLQSSSTASFVISFKLVRKMGCWNGRNSEKEQCFSLITLRLEQKGDG